MIPFYHSQNLRNTRCLSDCNDKYIQNFGADTRIMLSKSTIDAKCLRNTNISKRAQELWVLLAITWQRTKVIKFRRCHPHSRTLLDPYVFIWLLRGFTISEQGYTNKMEYQTSWNRTQAIINVTRDSRIYSRTIKIYNIAWPRYIEYGLNMYKIFNNHSSVLQHIYLL